MSYIKDNFLGGAEKRAGRIQADALGRSQDFIREGTKGAQGELNSAFDDSQGYLEDALQKALGAQGTGLQDIIASLTGQSGQAINTLQEGEGRGISALLSGLQGAEVSLNPFITGGNDAYQVQLAQSGALGADAQQKAFEAFNASPAQAFLRDQGEQSIARQASASGGLGGGALKADLQRFGTGLAQQDFQNQYNRLGELAGRGQSAATTLSQFGVGTGQGIADLIRGTSGGVAGLQDKLGSQLAQAFGTSANNLSSLFGDHGRQLSGLRTELGTNLGNLLTGESANLASLEGGKGMAIAQGILDSAAQVRAFEDQQFERGKDAYTFGFGGKK